MDNTTAAVVDGNPDDMPYSGNYGKWEKRKEEGKETSEIYKMLKFEINVRSTGISIKKENILVQHCIFFHSTRGTVPLISPFFCSPFYNISSTHVLILPYIVHSPSNPNEKNTLSMTMHFNHGHISRPELNSHLYDGIEIPWVPVWSFYPWGGNAGWFIPFPDNYAMKQK